MVTSVGTVGLVEICITYFRFGFRIPVRARIVNTMVLLILWGCIICYSSHSYDVLAVRGFDHWYWHVTIRWQSLMELLPWSETVQPLCSLMIVKRWRIGMFEESVDKKMEYNTNLVLISSLLGQYVEENLAFHQTTNVH